ncbi:hypothetical protein [Brevibacterium linens]|uniref:hypothetical protein n=1 Tax=Brevibacterium linens TaxID=1703 RepID=UPI00351456D1
MSDLFTTTAVGTRQVRLDGPAKVRGLAPYAYEHPLDDPLFLYPLQSQIARARTAHIDVSAAEAAEGVVYVLTADNAPELASTDDGELAILRSAEIGFRGQYLGAVIATAPSRPATRRASSRSPMCRTITTSSCARITLLPGNRSPAAGICAQAMSTQPSLRRPYPSMSATAPPWSTTIPWNRIPPSPSGTETN